MHNRINGGDCEGPQQFQMPELKFPSNREVHAEAMRLLPAFVTVLYGRTVQETALRLSKGALQTDARGVWVPTDALLPQVQWANSLAESQAIFLAHFTAMRAAVYGNLYEQMDPGVLPVQVPNIGG